MDWHSFFLYLLLLFYKYNTISSNDVLQFILQILKRVDFSSNPHYEPEFKWHDITLLEAVQSDNEHAHNFFRLLSLCHTVMPEYKDGRYADTKINNAQGSIVEYDI